MPFVRVDDCNRDNIQRLGGRMHATVQGRFVTVLLHGGELFCIDSCCFHASGPLGEGPVMDIEDIPTIRCQWHNMIIALDTGERVTQQILLPGEAQGLQHHPVAMSFPLRPQGTAGKARRHGEYVQRVHPVRAVECAGADPGRWPIEIDLDADVHRAHPAQSDQVACNPQYARMCITMQQRKIDTGALLHREGAGESDENDQREIQNSFVRSLVQTLQTAVQVPGGCDVGGGSSSGGGLRGGGGGARPQMATSAGALERSPSETSDPDGGWNPSSPNGPPGNPRAPTPPPDRSE